MLRLPLSTFALDPSRILLHFLAFITPMTATSVASIAADLSQFNLIELTPLSPEVIQRQATVNIGTIGHVAHGKSTVVKAISGVQVRKGNDPITFYCSLSFL